MNYQKLWVLLMEYIAGKNSHGKNELLTLMREMEIEEVKNSIK